MFSKCATYDLCSSSEDADMLSSSDEEDDDYNIGSNNYHHSEKDDICKSNTMSMFENDMNFVYNMQEVDNRKEKLETTNAVEDENHVIVWVVMLDSQTNPIGDS